MIYLYLFGTCFHFIYVFMIILNKLQDICHELNELRQYDILNALPKLIKDSPNEGYVVDSNAFDECMDKVLYKR